MLCSLEERDSTVPRRGYKLFVNAVYKRFVLAIVMLHIALALFEPDTQSKLTQYVCVSVCVVCVVWCVYCVSCARI